MGHCKGHTAIILGSLLVSALNGRVDDGLEDSGAIAVIPCSKRRRLSINTGPIPLLCLWFFADTIQIFCNGKKGQKRHKQK